LHHLTLTPSERRALLVLLALILVGSVVRTAKHIWPQRLPGYHVQVDTLAALPTQPPVDAAQRKLERGIDPNSAPQEDLELLPGIGPALAARIVADRTAHGPYDSARTLTRVPGIGPALAQKLTPHLRFP
jgi:DNA uptake protein ComE-like DNA-binding protein